MIPPSIAMLCRWDVFSDECYSVEIFNPLKTSLPALTTTRVAKYDDSPTLSLSLNKTNPIHPLNPNNQSCYFYFISKKHISEEIVKQNFIQFVWYHGAR